MWFLLVSLVQIYNNKPNKKNYYFFIYINSSSLSSSSFYLVEIEIERALKLKYHSFG